MTHRISSLIVVALLALSAVPASAQDVEEVEAPRYRVDLDVFTPGWFVAARDRGEPNGWDTVTFLSGQVGVRAAFRAGHGFFTDVSLSSGALEPVYLLHEVGYLHRFRLEGDDARGLALELQAGLSGGYWDGSVAGSGPIGGPNVAVSIDGRVDAFVLGLMIRHRVLFDGARTQQMTSAILRVTFGFWG